MSRPQNAAAAVFLCVTLAALGMFPGAAIAASPVAVNAEVSPSIITRSTTELTVRLTIANLGAEQSFGIEMFAPRFVKRSGALTRLEGAPIYLLVAPPVVEGLTPVGLSRITDALPACSPTHHMPHGFGVRNFAGAFTLPAAGIGTATFRFALKTPVVDSMQIVPDLALTRTLPDRSIGTLEQDIPVSVSEPEYQGKPAAYISFSTSPRSTITPLAQGGNVRLGRTVKITGKVRSARRGARVVLRATTYRPKVQMRTIARARLDGRHRFSAKWKPTKRSGVEIWAFYPSQRGALASGYSCPLGMHVK